MPLNRSLTVDTCKKQIIPILVKSQHSGYLRYASTLGLLFFIVNNRVCNPFSPFRESLKIMAPFKP